MKRPVPCSLAEQTVQELPRYSRQLEGTLTSALSSSGAIILSDALPAFSFPAPAYRFELHEGTTFQVIDLLNATGVIELGIVLTPFHSEGFETHFLESEAMVAVGAPAFWRHQLSIGSPSRRCLKNRFSLLSPL